MLAKMTPHQRRPLTPVERRIALLAAAGWTDGEIASELGLGITSVEWHLSRAARKLGVRSRSGLAAGIADSSAGPVGEERH